MMFEVWGRFGIRRFGGVFILGWRFEVWEGFILGGFRVRVGYCFFFISNYVFK